MLISTFEILAVAIVLLGLWYEEELIAFERRAWDKFTDYAAVVVAAVIIKHRRAKKARMSK